MDGNRQRQGQAPDLSNNPQWMWTWDIEGAGAPGTQRLAARGGRAAAHLVPALLTGVAGSRADTAEHL